jgi:hypothetical protein
MNGIFEVLGKNKKYIKYISCRNAARFDYKTLISAGTIPPGTCSARASRPCFQKVLSLVTYRARAAAARARGPCNMARQLEAT